jgi:hypothetical protein
MKREEIFNEVLHTLFAIGTITIALGVLRKLLLEAPSPSASAQNPRRDKE